jgi:hypothetical protein
MSEVTIELQDRFDKAMPTHWLGSMVGYQLL